jgi:hypothetical protein
MKLASPDIGIGPATSSAVRASSAASVPIQKSEPSGPAISSRK